MTHYDVLGVSMTASTESIRRAYVELARRHHPDFHTTAGPAARDDADREMRRINEAWRVLGDAAKRRDYDQAIDPAAAAAEPASTSGVEGGGWRPGSGTAHPDFVPFGGDDDFDAFDDDEAREAYLDSLDDTPFARARAVPAWQQLLPVAMVLTALACLCVGLVISLAPLLGLGVILLVLSGLAFVLTPMLAVMRSYDRDPD